MQILWRKNEEKYRETGDQPNGKKTLKSYLWSLEIASYDQAHPRS